MAVPRACCSVARPVRGSPRLLWCPAAAAPAPPPPPPHRPAARCPPPAHCPWASAPAFACSVHLPTSSFARRQTLTLSQPFLAGSPRRRVVWCVGLSGHDVPFTRTVDANRFVRERPGFTCWNESGATSAQCREYERRGAVGGSSGREGGSSGREGGSSGREGGSIGRGAVEGVRGSRGESEPGGRRARGRPWRPRRARGHWARVLRRWGRSMRRAPPARARTNAPPTERERPSGSCVGDVVRSLAALSSSPLRWSVVYKPIAELFDPRSLNA
jgi:hypothetical protein